MSESATRGLLVRRRIGAMVGFPVAAAAVYLGWGMRGQALGRPDGWFVAACTLLFLLVAVLGGLRATGGKRRRLFYLAVLATAGAAGLHWLGRPAIYEWTAAYVAAGLVGLLFMTSHFRESDRARIVLKAGGNLLFIGALAGLGVWVREPFFTLGLPFVAAGIPLLLVVALVRPEMLDDPQWPAPVPGSRLDVTKADHLMPVAQAGLEEVDREPASDLARDFSAWLKAQGKQAASEIPRSALFELMADFLVHHRPDDAVRLAQGPFKPAVIDEIAREAAAALKDEARRKPVSETLAAFGIGGAQHDAEALFGLVLVRPSLAARLAELLGIAVPFALAQQAELDEIRISRGLRTAEPAPGPAGPSEQTFHQRLGATPDGHAPRYAPRQAFGLDLMGVAFSGGGIRSATFNLGVLQGLAELRLLPRVDYLSTVSGGGYIGSWLVSWAKRLQGGVRSVQTRLSPHSAPDPNAPATRPIRFLREYSSYLTPENGLLSADSWTLVGIWLRNTILVQSVLVLFLAAVLALPLNLGILARFLNERPPSVTWIVGAAGLWLFFVLCLRMGTELSRFVKADARRVGTLDETWAPRSKAGLRSVQRTIVAPGFLCTLLLGICLWSWKGEERGLPAWLGATGSPHLDRVGLFAALLYVVGLLIVEVRAGYAASLMRPPGKRKRAVSLLVVVLATLGPAIVAAAMTMGVLALYGLWKDAHYASWHVVALGPPLMALIVGSLLIHHVGLLGRGFDDDRREWLSRLTAWLFIWCAGWLVLFGFAIYAPWAVGWAGRRLAAAGGVAWLASAVWGAWLGRSGSRTGKGPASGGMPQRLKNAVAMVAPYVFVVGLLVAISVGLHALIAVLHGTSLVAVLASVDGYWEYLGSIGGKEAAGLLGFFSVVALLLAWRIDVNEFSMHHLYKNRLVRCYLGASREGSPHPRHPHPFTGFDRDDDVRLATLRTDPGLAPRATDARAEEEDDSEDADEKTAYRGPLPVICTALNLVKGDDLAWQERKAQSFVFTPLFSGFEHLPTGRRATRTAPHLKDDGLRPTASYAYAEGGVRLGTAMAISGAAANPNMGYHSSPATAFLMTMFNVRLGWWMGNPRHEGKWRQSSPTLGLSCLIDELAGNTANHSPFVNLSDGGHFENLGVYELVRRRCRFILACDAEQDGDFTFAGLGSMVRKCRTDFGVQITFPCDSVVFQGADRFKKVHAAVGEILYPGGERGWLLYVKSSLSEDQTSDLLEYSRRVKAFPHESTADQWFDESQFESYRQLGQAIILRVLGAGAAAFEAVDDCWLRVFSPLSPAVPAPPPLPGPPKPASPGTLATTTLDSVLPPPEPGGTQPPLR